MSSGSEMGNVLKRVGVGGTRLSEFGVSAVGFIRWLFFFFSPDIAGVGKKPVENEP